MAAQKSAATPDPAAASSAKKKLDVDTLSARQRRILEVIRDAIVLRGYPPSIREIGDAAGLQSTSSVAYQLKELEKKGFLRRDPNKPPLDHCLIFSGEASPILIESKVLNSNKEHSLLSL